MVTYRNSGGDSNVRAFEIGGDSITVQFGDGSIYVYTYQSAGRDNIERMKALAIAGRGLNSFIMRYVKMAYASKR
ncbi:MAG: hypothetical protein HZB19_19170 [Chloroflexi bacterium]|nr:hypothetical protein [Chloroflexota bacterium]